MKQRSPFHFVAGFVQAIAPDAQRMWRQTERCGILRMPPCRSSSWPRHACPRTPEEQSGRCPCAHRNSVEVSYAPSTASSCPVLSAFSEASRCVHACAELPRSADGAPTASNLSSKDRVSGSSAPLPARFDTRPQHARTRMGCRPLPRNDEVPPEILHSSREPEWNENTPSKRSAGPGRLHPTD